MVYSDFLNIYGGRAAFHQKSCSGRTSQAIIRYTGRKLRRERCSQTWLRRKRTCQRLRCAASAQSSPMPLPRSMQSSRHARTHGACLDCSRRAASGLAAREYFASFGPSGALRIGSAMKGCFVGSPGSAPALKSGVSPPHRSSETLKIERGVPHAPADGRCRFGTPASVGADISSDPVGSLRSCESVVKQTAPAERTRWGDGAGKALSAGNPADARRLSAGQAIERRPTSHSATCPRRRRHVDTGRG